MCTFVLQFISSYVYKMENVTAVCVFVVGIKELVGL